MAIRLGRVGPHRRDVAFSSVESAHSTRCGPQSHRSPNFEAGFSGRSGMGASLAVSSPRSKSSSISRVSKPLKLRSKSRPFRSSISSDRSSISQSAQLTDLFTSRRKATCSLGPAKSEDGTSTFTFAIETRCEPSWVAMPTWLSGGNSGASGSLGTSGNIGSTSTQGGSYGA